MFRKILAALGTAALAIGLSAVAVAAPASATHPTVLGTVSCNTTTGTFDITWRVSGDTTYKDATATITSATITSTIVGESPVTTTSLIGKTVKDASFVEATQQGATKDAKYQLTVKVQWTNHTAGDLVTQSSNFAVPSGSCAITQPNTATATLKITSASCSAPASMTYGDTKFASFTSGTPSGTTGATTGTALTHYSVTATSDNNHTFSDGTRTLVLQGDLDPQKTVNCAPASTCLPSSAVSYTYDPATNSGRVTVTDVANSTHVLCKPFWVTATSWKYTTTTLWPQALDIAQKLGPISAVGKYDFAAAVNCGQGDIYASFDAQPEPTAQLDGPSSPFAEHFLHEMGFTGPNPTYVQQDPACASVKPADPSHSNESCTAQVKVLGSITLGLETGLVYSIDGPGTANDISPVTTKTTAGLPAGDYLVSVAAATGYTLGGADKFTVKIDPAACGQLDTHPLVTPVASSTSLSCTAVGTYTLTSNPGVLWTINGAPAKAGTYQVSTTSTVLATATPNAPGYGFEAGIPNPKTYTFSFTKPDAATCGTQLTTLAYTGVTSSLWLILSGGLVFLGVGGLLIARRRWVGTD